MTSDVHSSQPTQDLTKATEILSALNKLQASVEGGYIGIMVTIDHIIQMTKHVESLRVTKGSFDKQWLVDLGEMIGKVDNAMDSCQTQGLALQRLIADYEKQFNGSR